jgi:FkbM family methyltransferase
LQNFLEVVGSKLITCGGILQCPAYFKARLSGVRGLWFFQQFVAPYFRDFKIRSVIDIGAHRGEFAKLAKYVFDEAELYCFEPIEERALELQRLLSDKKGEVFNFALGSSNANRMMEVFRFDAASSLRAATGMLREKYGDLLGSSTARTVEVRKLDEVLLPTELKREILIKLDVQGYEDEVIKGGQEVFGAAKVVIVELSFVREYEEQPLFHDIYGVLHQLGFQFLGLFPNITKDPETKQIWQADGLFVRS